jgi:hypothetical protein
VASPPGAAARWAFCWAGMDCKLLLGLFACVDMARADTSGMSGWAPFVEIDLWRAADAMPVSQIDSDWRTGFSPRAGRNVALTRNRAIAGAESTQWRIGYEVRQDASLDTDRETLEMVRLYKQRQDPEAPRTFDAHAKYLNWSARGLRIGRHLEGPKVAGRPIRILLSAAWYGDARYRRDEAAGSVRYLGAGAYAFNASEIDIDSRERLPFLNGNTDASGISISVASEVPLSESLTLHIKIDDLWSRLRWRNLPVSRQTINSNVTSTDSEGFLNYRPLLTGRNEQIDDALSLRRYGAAELSYRHGDWRYATQIERFAGVTIPTFSVGRHFAWGEVTARFETRFHSVGLGYAFGNFRVLLQSDAFNQSKAKAQAILLSYSRSL